MTAHRDTGLPAAADIVRDAFRAVAEPGRRPRGLPVAVLRIWAEQFGWAARAEFGADVLVDVIDADEGVEALAEFLWSARHSIPAVPADDV